MKVFEAMTKKPVSLSLDTFLCDAAMIMQSRRIGSILVIDKGKLEGIVTERDIIGKVLAFCKDPKEIRLRDIMSKPVISIREDEELVAAAELMKKHDIRRLAVINEDEKLVGILCVRDIASSLRRSTEELAITYYLMSRKKETQ